VDVVGVRVVGVVGVPVAWVAGELAVAVGCPVPLHPATVDASTAAARNQQIVAVDGVTPKH
jgi:hypothetical protein